MATDALDLKTVVEQFRSSEDTLQELRERLRALVLAEESAEGALSTIENGANALSSSTRALEAMVVELQASRRATVDALDAARSVLSGNDLNQVREDVQALTTLVQEGFASTRAELQRLAESTRTIGELEGELERVKDLVPARTRKKHGL